MDSNKALDALSALAHPGRLAIFRLLVAAGEAGLPAGEIAVRLGQVQNTASTNLAILARAGLIAGRRHGRSIRYAADFARAGALIGFLLEDCCGGRPEICLAATRKLSCVSPADRETAA
jgi:DNA-binding transcriptional ArsR family regulator